MDHSSKTTWKADGNSCDELAMNDADTDVTPLDPEVQESVSAVMRRYGLSGRADKPLDAALTNR